MSYVYDELTGLLESVTLVTGGAETILYDGLERVSKRTYTTSSGTELYSRIYSYVTPDGTTDSTTSGLVASYDVVRGTTGLASYDYTYDEMGRITSDGTYTYTYDALGQLLTVKNSSGTVVESYTYDGAGNILTATKNGTSHTYTYGNTNWRDQLTAYDGTSITYDAIGNPTSYRGWTFTWDNGRELTAASNGSTGVSYTYDANGIRYTKTVGGVTHSYLYSGSTLLQEKYGTTVLRFLYTSDGTPYAVRYSADSNSTYKYYYYITNLQGDVIGLMNSSGNIVVSYTYDSWGMLLSTTGSLASTVGAANPLRYRGYYYDTETGLYYLQSRYYDPQVGRFVNADALASTGQGVLGYNMFAYCLNNPVVYADDGGDIPVPSILDFYWFHRKVQEDICRNHPGWIMEVYVIGAEKNGRLDIYNPFTNEFYEVKHIGQAGTQTTEKQIERYQGSEIRSDKVPVSLEVKLTPVLGGDRFWGTAYYGFYIIDYRCMGDGIVVYTYRIDLEKVAAAAALVAVGAAASEVEGAGGIGVTKEAFGY